MDGGQQQVDIGWRTVGEILLTAFIAIEGWLLRKVWNSKLDRDEALRMWDEWSAKDEARDAKQLEGIRDELESMRREARQCFDGIGVRIGCVEAHQRDEHAENVARLEKLDDKIERLLYAVARPKGH